MATKFEEIKKDDISIVTVHLPRATLMDAPGFKEFLANIIQKGVKKIVIDLRECLIIDSTFIGAMVASLKKITIQNGNIRLVYDENMQSTIFMLTKIDKVFKMFTNLDEAVESFS